LSKQFREFPTRRADNSPLIPAEIVSIKVASGILSVFIILNIPVYSGREKEKDTRRNYG
jgi:hypothetical protein